MNKVKVIVQFSGGKDSQACLIKACEDFGANNVTAVFCDTRWEHEQTYSHVKEIVARDERYKQRVIDLENEVNLSRDKGKEASFFCKGKIPARFCIQNSNGAPTFAEISDYVLRNENQPTLWDDTEPIMSCVSLYHGLCE